MGIRSTGFIPRAVCTTERQAGGRFKGVTGLDVVTSPSKSPWSKEEGHERLVDSTCQNDGRDNQLAMNIATTPCKLRSLASHQYLLF